MGGGECVLIVKYLINQTPSLLNRKYPFELLHGHTSSYAHIKIFGYLAFAHDHDLPKDKFRTRSRPCVFTGYPFGKKEWRLYDIQNKKFFISCDVVFVETQFPYITKILSGNEITFPLEL